ncbi:hypothetical protein KEM52_003028, partial [Ascosphaera acerosa]
LDAGDVAQAEVDEGLVAVLAEVLDEAVAGQRLLEADGRQPVLGEAEVEQRRDVDVVRAQLLLLLGEVGAADLEDCAGNVGKVSDRPCQVVSCRVVSSAQQWLVFWAQGRAELTKPMAHFCLSLDSSSSISGETV